MPPVRRPVPPPGKSRASPLLSPPNARWLPPCEPFHKFPIIPRYLPNGRGSPPRMKPSIPPCRDLGAHCRSLRVTLRIGELEEGLASLDHEATWLLGHTEQITFLELWEGEGDLYVEAILHVPCRWLLQQGERARCRVHGFEGPAPRGARRQPQPLQLGGDRFVVVERCRNQVRNLPFPRRSL